PNLIPSLAGKRKIKTVIHHQNSISKPKSFKRGLISFWFILVIGLPVVVNAWHRHDLDSMHGSCTQDKIHFHEDHIECDSFHQYCVHYQFSSSRS
ncbi:MAG: hypothetical protein ACPG59_06095, partial [Flavobacteriaceae bacterium]